MRRLTMRRVVRVLGRETRRVETPAPAGFGAEKVLFFVFLLCSVSAICRQARRAAPYLGLASQQANTIVCMRGTLIDNYEWRV